MSHAMDSCMLAECLRMPWCPTRLQHQCALSLAQRYTLIHLCRFPCITFSSQEYARCTVYVMMGFQRPKWRKAVHTAQERRLHNFNSAHIEEICNALQVSGLSNMMAGLQPAPLHQMHVFSSVSADVGNAGQSNYAAANAAITAMMQTAAQQVSR